MEGLHCLGEFCRDLLVVGGSSKPVICAVLPCFRAVIVS